VPPHKIAIVDENGNTRGTTVGPYMEGDSLRLFCDVHGGEYPSIRDPRARERAPAGTDLWPFFYAGLAAA